jgi:hypothetical protein
MIVLRGCALRQNFEQDARPDEDEEEEEEGEGGRRRRVSQRKSDDGGDLSPRSSFRRSRRSESERD